MAEPSTRGATNTVVTILGAMVDTGDFPIVVVASIVSVRGATSTTVNIKGE